MLRVLTLNLWRDAGPWPARAACIRAWLEQLDPDLIAFQEVGRAADVDLARELFRGRPHALAFDDADNAIAARWPILRTEMALLPGKVDGDARSALLCDVASPHGTLLFFNTHLDWGNARDEIRAGQVTALSEFVQAQRARSGFPPIIVGDFNAEPESDEVRRLTGRRTRWIDAWRAAGDGGPGFTCATRNVYARLTGEPDRRIDYIFVGEPGTDGRGGIESCRIVCDDDRDGVWPSDHFGVYAELRTEPS